MSGHSKWATTKHRKGAKDSARAKVFAKLIRQVEVAAREGAVTSIPTRRFAPCTRRPARLRCPSTRSSGPSSAVPVSWRACATRPSVTRVMARRRRGDRRNADGQSQPHERRDQARVRAQRRNDRGTGRGVVAVRPQGSHRVKGPVDEDQLLEWVMDAGGENFEANGETSR